MADFRDYLSQRYGGESPIQQPSYQPGAGGYDFRSFLNYYDQVQQANQQLQQDDRSAFSMSGGTENLFNGRYRRANAPESAAIEVGNWGEFWNNLPGQIAGAVAGDQAREDWTFDASKFDLTNGLDVDDLTQVRNFAVSLPGMIPGGIFEGVSRGYEALSGAPIREYRKSEEGYYELPDYTLDQSQRVASGIDAAIDIGGTFLGASGKAVSVAGRGVAKAAEKKALSGAEKLMGAGTREEAQAGLSAMTEGERLYNKANKINEFGNNLGRGIFDRAGFGGGVQFAGNVAEEAGEEFVQSYMDDIRMKNLDEHSFDRAVTGAAWGAAGGGLMHGAAAGLNSLFKSDGNDVGDVQDAIEASQSERQFEKDKDRNAGMLGNTWARGVVAKADEKVRDPNAVPASSSQYATVFDDDLNIKQVRLTDGMLHDMMQMADDGETVNELAKRFHTTVDRLVQVDEIATSAEKAAAWRQLLKEAIIANGGRPVRIVGGRNPDTNEVGTVFLDIADIVAGHGVQMHSWTYKALGGDMDGDKFQSYIGPGARAGGYLTTSLYDPYTGKSRIDSDYVTFLGERSTVGVFHQVLVDLNQVLDEKFSDEEIKSLTTQYRKAITSNDVDATMKVLDSFYGKVKAKVKEGNPVNVADDAMSDMVSRLHIRATATKSTFDDVFGEMSRSMTADQRSLVRELAQLVPEDERFLRSGDNQGKTHFADFAGLFGAKIFTNVGIAIGNPIMRQSAAYRYDVKKDQDVFFGEDLSAEDVSDRYEKLIAFSFMLDQIGGNVENSIEGVFRLSVFERVIGRYEASGRTKVDIESGWTEFKEIFVDEYNTLVGRFNDSLEKASTDADMPVVVGAKKSTISQNSQAEVAAAFHDVFGNMKIEELLDITPDNPTYGMTINQLIRDYSKAPGRDAGPFSNYEGFGDFFMSLCRDEGRKSRALGTRFEEEVRNIAQKLREWGFVNAEDLYKVIVDEDGSERVVIATDDDIALSYAYDAAIYMIGVDEAWNLGIHSLESFLTTRYGQMWMSGDVDSMLAVLVSAKLSSKYSDAIDIYQNKGDTWRNDLQLELGRLAEEGGMLEACIYEWFEKHGDLNLLMELTDLDSGYAHKSDLWDKLIVGYDGAGPLVSEVFDSSEELGTSIHTKSLREAKKSMVEAARRSNSANLATLDRISNLDTVSDTQKISAIKHFASTGYTTMSMHSIASFVHSQRDVVKGMVDKGVAPTTSDILYQMCEHAKNGDIFSFLEQVDYEFGTIEIGKLQVNRVQLLKILFDDEASVRIYDHVNGGYAWITRKAIFDEVNGKDSNLDPDRDWQAWDNLMRACPSIVSLLAPTHIGTRTLEGNTSVNEGFNKTLDRAIVDFRRDGEDTTSQYQIRQLRNEAMQIMFADPNWWGVLIASTEGLSESDSLSRTRSLVEKSLNDHVDWVMAYAAMDPNGEGYFEKCFQWYWGGMSASVEVLEHVISDSMIADTISRTYGSLDSQVSASILSDLLKSRYIESINEMLRDAGINEVESSQMSMIDSDDLSIDFSDMANEAKEDVRRALVALVNMVDMSQLKVDKYISTVEAWGTVNEIIDQYRQDNPNMDQKTRDKIEAIEKKQDDLKQGSVREILDFLGISDVFGIVDEAEFPMIIPADAVDSMSESEFTSKCLEICKLYNVNDDFGKTRSAIKKAFAENDRDAKVDIKNYYNQVVLTYSLNNLIEPGSTYNPVAAKQILEAHRTMMEVGDRVRKEIGDRLEDTGAKLPKLNFGYADTVKSYMASTVVMNAASGPITTGIGLDGSMMKMVAGLGLLDEIVCGIEPEVVKPSALDEKKHVGMNYVVRKTRKDSNGDDIINPDGTPATVEYTKELTARDIRILKKGTEDILVYDPAKCLCGACDTCGPKSRSKANPNSNFVGRSIAAFVNWMQEQSHLRLKKALGAAKAFADPMVLGTDLHKGYSVSKLLRESANERKNVQPGSVEASRILVRKAVDLHRSTLKSRWKTKFMESGIDRDIGFGDEQATAFANLMTPLIEVIVDDNVFYVSTTDLANDGLFAQYDFGFGPGFIGSDSVVVRPVVMSLQEVSEKVVRDVCEEYYSTADQGSEPTAADVRGWANNAMKSWSSYNSSPISIRQFLNGIKAQGPRIDMPMTGDAVPTARMQWNDDKFQSMKAIFAPRRKTGTKPMTETTWRQVVSFNDIFKGYKKKGEPNDIPSNVMFVRVSGEVESRLFEDRKLYGINLPSDEKIGDELVYWDKDSNQNQQLCEIYIGDNASGADAAYRHASHMGRDIFVPMSVIENMSAPSYFELMNALGSVDMIYNGVKYARISPDMASYIRAHGKQSLQIPVTALDPDEISIAVATMKRLGLPDAGHYSHPDWQPKKLFQGAVDVLPSKLLHGNNPVELVTDVDEIAKIRVDQLDLSYYEGNVRNKDLSVFMKDAVKLINDAGETGRLPGYNENQSITNVQQGGCVGFVKHSLAGDVVEYAPLFYDGSVASVADVVKVKQNRDGSVRISYSASNVDYSGNESMKLDMYGVAYKSVGHKASDEILKKWAVIDDGGFGVVTRADHMFDGQSLGSRVVQMGDAILHRNVFFYTRKAGTNLFFERKGKGQWVKRGDLSEDMDDAFMNDLINGSFGAWSKVASGQRSIYRDVKANSLIRRAVQDTMYIGGFPHLLFNSARVKNGKFVGLERRVMDPQAIFKNWNTDDFLYLWNHIDGRLCPATLSEDPNTDGNIKVFDAQGRMLDRNTRSGQPERVATLIGPHFYTGEGTAIGDASRSASWSQQHTLKRLLDLGIFPKDIGNTIAALGVSIENFDKLESRSTREERVAEWQKRNADWRKRAADRVINIDESTRQRARMAISDPVFLDSIQTRRQEVSELGHEFYDPLTITKSFADQEPAINDENLKKRIQNNVEKLNNALGGPASNNKLTLSEIIGCVRYSMGYSRNNGLGIQSITMDQFERAIEYMIDNLKTHGHIIVGGRYAGGRDRVSIPLLPRGMVTRLATMPVYQAKFDGDVDAIIDEQYSMLVDDTMPAIKAIKDPSKRNALFKLVDAACYMNGRDEITGHIGDNVHMHDLVSATREFSNLLSSYDPELFELYDQAVRLNDEYATKLANAAIEAHSTRMELPNGDYRLVMHNSDRTIVTYILRQLTAARRAIGMTYTMMLPSNLVDRKIGQAGLSWAMRFGRWGIGPYRVNNEMDPNIRRAAVKSGDFRKLWSALREAQLLGVDRELLSHMTSGNSLDEAIAKTFKEQGAIERFNNKLMNIMSGKDAMIDEQMLTFLDRFWQRSESEAPWWHMKLPGHTETVFEQRLANDPAGLMIDLFNGTGQGQSADMLLARQCMEFSKAGDMAQKNIVSAIWSEIAKRSAVADFAMTSFITPYFQYATNRMGRILNWVAPISSIHYLVTEFMTQGVGSTWKFGDGTFGDLGLDEVQMKASLKEAIWCDVCHLGVGLVAMLLVGLASEVAGILEPPEDDRKKGNFKEWTVFGMRVDDNWWIEDAMGLALPLATFYASCMEGDPRIDLVSNGIAYYLSNNPVTKVADAVAILFDPMAELYQEYDKDLEGYAKAMGGPPDVWTILKGKSTSFGLSYVSQFITPGFIKEWYNASQGNEVSYKRIYETDATGKLTMDAKERNITQYTSYEDAVLRKFTKNNPIMGFIADALIHPETGYMYHEMPDKVIYDPIQMNSIEAFSIYEDPYTKKVPKSYEDQYAIGLDVISILQANSIQELKEQGFMIDYDTKKLVSQMIWDQIASENAQWADLEQSGALSYYNAGYGDYDENVRVISQMKETHYNFISKLKKLYNEKLWSDDLYAAQYNQHHTKWFQDVNGEWYAAGYANDMILSPVTIAPGETQSGYQYVMGPEDDWETESIVTGQPTGIRGLIPVDLNRVDMPDKPRIESWSTDGTDTGHSKFYYDLMANGLEEAPGGSSSKNTAKFPAGGGRGGSGGGGGGGGGRGGSSAPNAYAPSISLPRANAGRIMNTDRLVQPNYDYLRPDFETKGSREAYRRSDI